jgi:methyl-accepting chemotaxis protein
MKDASTLKGKHRYVTAPSVLAGLAGAALATLYALMTLRLPPDSTVQFWVCVAVAVVIGNLLGDRAEQRTLMSVRQLGEGKLAATPENLIRALTDLARLPDVTFWSNLSFWTLGVVITALAFVLWVPAAGTAVGLRIFFIGTAVAPMVSLLAHVLVLRRARRVMTAVAALGVSTIDAMKALPARFQMRYRLMVYAAISVLTPMVLVADFALHHMSNVGAKLLRTPVANQSALLEQAFEREFFSVVLVSALVMAIVLLCGYLGGTAVGEPMQQLAGTTRRIADAKLGLTPFIAAEDEVWAAAAALASMEQHLVVAVRQLKEAGVQITTTTEELVGSTARHEAGASEQAAALAETSATTEELARSARQIAGNATAVSAMASQTLSAAQQGKQSADAFFSSVLKVREGNQAIADSVVKLNKRVQQVGRIVEFIDGIADKSDLLAVNAELEGTKAGEVGRGFSLVAAEMRRLSESVMRSTKEIARLIEEIRDATHAAVMATEAGVKATDAGSTLAQQVSETLGEIVDFANQTADAIRAITLATHQQQTGTDQLVEAMNDILKSTETGAAASAQMANANSDLGELAARLGRTVQKFDVAPS